ncbi:hypothetical protein [Hyphomonas sp.]|jgi:ElaB/YqjD/DUF883 family membrane-anchored ribosome-binding protein|uniref:DUF883 family protein n=1 Tax=Hyphomonas sp. TaxID=87 RepID=UPI0025B979C1|nr:hypothetical protein [Hyphomonas sp.]
MSDSASNASKRAKAAADKATRELEARLEALREEMDEILSTLGKKTETKADALADIFSGEAAEEVLGELRAIVTEIKEKAVAAEKKVVETARENPLQTLLVAFGVGFLASLLLRNK